MADALEMLGLSGTKGKSAAEILGIDAPEKELLPPPRTIGEAGRNVGESVLLEGTPEMIGGTVGGMAGSPWGLPGRVAGSALGGGLAETGRQLYEGERDPLTIGKAAGGAALRQGAGELAGDVAVRVGGKLLRPFAKSITPGIREARETFEAAGGQLLPSQVTKSRVLDLAENIAEGSFFGGGTVKTFKENQKVVLNRMASELPEQFGKTATPEEIGQVIHEAITDRREVFSKAGEALYKQVDKLMGARGKMPGAARPIGMVDVSAIKRLANSIAEGRVVSVTPSASGESIVNRALQLPDSLTFEQAHALRSELLSVTRGEHGNVAEGIAKKLAAIVDNRMTKAAEGISPEAAEAWRSANAFWKEGKEKFYNNFIQRLVKQDPEKIVDAIVKPGAVTPIKRIAEITDDETMNQIRSAAVKRMLTNASDKVTGDLSASALAGQLKQMREPTLNSLFTPGQAATLKKFIQVAELSQEKVGEGTGKVFIQLTQAGAILGALGGLVGGSNELTAASGTILIGPAVLSKLLTNPTAARWLTEGLMTPATSTRSGELMRKIVAASVRMGGRGAITTIGKGEGEQ